jgi:[acyl-carrier-protein] S-malonyltransferase
MRLLIGRGANMFVELGHGRVLRGLMRRIDKSQKAANIQDPDSLQKTLQELGIVTHVSKVKEQDKRG